MACGTQCQYTDSDCMECGHSFPTTAIQPIQNNYAAPVQHNTLNLAIPTEVYVERDEPKKEAKPFRFSGGWITSIALTFLMVTCGLVATSVFVFIFTVTFLAAARIH